MERSLSLVLDEMGEISLTLEKMESKKLDEYISKNFNSSEEIRKKYAAKINPYLEQHKDFITKVETDNNKRYAGSIVITELQDDLFIKRKKVLYKKDMIIFREITKNKKFVLALENRDYINYRNALKNDEKYDRIFSDYFGMEIRFRCTSDGKFNRTMGQWRNAIKDLNRYYDLIRTVLKEYKNRYRDLGLDSPDVVYSRYLAGQEVRYQSWLEEERQSDYEFAQAVKNGDKQALDLALHIDDYKEEKIDKTEEPVRYVSGADEDDYPGDLERWEKDQVSTIELEEGMSSSKTKSLNNGHYKLFDN